ncbi:hypothetical protein D3C78_1498570 [compost metagenome]
MLPAIGATAHHQTGQAAPLEAAQTLADLPGGEAHQGFATGFLVAGQHQGIQGQRIDFRGGRLLLDQTAEDASFGSSQR